MMTFAQKLMRLRQITFSQDTFNIGGFPFYVDLLHMPDRDKKHFAVTDVDVRRQIVENMDIPEQLKKYQDNIEIMKNAQEQMNEAHYANDYTTLKYAESQYNDAWRDAYDIFKWGLLDSDTTRNLEQYPIPYYKAHTKAWLDDFNKLKDKIAINPAITEEQKAQEAADIEKAKRWAEEISKYKTADSAGRVEEYNRLMEDVNKSNNVQGMIRTAGKQAMDFLLNTAIGTATSSLIIALLGTFIGYKLWQNKAIKYQRDKTCYDIINDTFTTYLTKEELQKLSAKGTLIRIGFLYRIRVFSEVLNTSTDYYKPSSYLRKFKTMEQLKQYAKTL